MLPPRSVHVLLVDTPISKSYRHWITGIEYWQHIYPSSGETTAKGNVEGEDPTCSASIPLRTWEFVVHYSHKQSWPFNEYPQYFEILATTPFYFWGPLGQLNWWVESISFSSLYDFPWFDFDITMMKLNCSSKVIVAWFCLPIIYCSSIIPILNYNHNLKLKQSPLLIHC